MEILAYQPPLRPALPCVYGPVEYREQRALFERIDKILGTSGLEDEFVALVLAGRQIDIAEVGAGRLERLVRWSILAFRSNIARHITGMGHRDFCARLADSPLLPWFLQLGQVDAVKLFSKSTNPIISHNNFPDKLSDKTNYRTGCRDVTSGRSRRISRFLPAAWVHGGQLPLSLANPAIPPHLPPDD